LSHADKVDRLFKAVLPVEAANAFAPSRGVLHIIAEKLKGHTTPADISEVMSDVTALLDLSVDAEAYVISQPVSGTAHLMDLSRLDFDKLRERFERGRKRTEADNLRALLNRKLDLLQPEDLN
jgi:type I restriction enzyme R subunit